MALELHDFTIPTHTNKHNLGFSCNYSCYLGVKNLQASLRYGNASSMTCEALACSRLRARDSGEKSFSKKKCEKCAGAGERLSPIFLTATAPFPKSRASYFRFARFNTSALYYLRAWHRLARLLLHLANFSTLSIIKVASVKICQ